MCFVDVQKQLDAVAQPNASLSDRPGTLFGLDSVKRSALKVACLPGTSNSSLSSGCHTIRRKSPQHRHHPYNQFPATVCKPAASEQQQAPAAPSTPGGCLAWHSLAPCDESKQHHQQWHQPNVPGVAVLQDQPFEKLLDIAISLTSRSLARTMTAFQAACQCWAYDADSDLASRSLGYAESCMARTIHRMQIAQQLASAVVCREQQCQQPTQALEQHQAVTMLQLLQHQQLQVVVESDEEGEEEVCSSFTPAA